MGTEYFEPADPIRSVRVRPGVAHTEITLFDNQGAHIGQLRLLNDDAKELLHVLHPTVVAKRFMRGEGERPGLHMLKLITKRTLMTEYGEVVSVNELAQYEVVTTPEEWDLYEATGKVPKWIAENDPCHAC